MKRILLLGCFFLSLALIDCGKGGEDKEIAESIARGALVLDVRTPNEYSIEHFPGAVNIPISSLSLRLDELGARDREIVVYCQSGGRSLRAKSLLNDKGFGRVKDAGGLQHLFSATSK
ncbi:rhodanese-like domain-containing protein [Leptospira langatensis]|uniref:Rhodanese-like domain-containing protein n=1 Tax=Leptospira langatensis TaxID=2484983 RepID=A0A5F1ZUE8_9LEPT|nr:rhodanese-like domain-containing protein [Leptospira langatensis]TGJ98868.1 rhodanese-like domain-containing protein [Leptospira langatensis]TGL40565.1 rhodanese-like domain-containing protein [Leptospira langatensis]